MNRILIGRPVAVTMFLLAVTVFGFVSLGKLPVSLVPDTDIPVITVKVVSPDRSSREIYELMVDPLRGSLSQTPGLKDMKCTVRDGSALISLTFDYGMSDDYMLIDVNERVDRAVLFWPDGEEHPIVSRTNVTDIPAFFIDVTMKRDASEEEFAQLGEFVRQVVARRIEQLPQVAMVDISGVTGMQYSIEPDPSAMTAAGVTKSQLSAIVGQSDFAFGNISLADGERSLDIRFESAITGAEDIGGIWINAGGRPLKTSDLANVKEESQPVQGYVTSDGRRAVTIAVIKRSDARMSDLKNSVSELLDSFEDEYYNLDFKLTRDQTALLDYSIDSMFKNLAIGALLACLVIFLFMNDMFSSILVAMTVPVSLLLAFTAFHILGISLNVISLSGLLLGTGMTVDNSIVVTDNIGRHRMSGALLADACVEGTREVFVPMLSSVLTTCALFIPLVFMSGIAGALFYDEAMAVTVTLFSALMVSVTVLPVFYYAFFKRRPGSFARRRVLDEMRNIYENVLSFMLRNRGAAWAGVFAMVVAAAFLLPSLEKKKLPDMSYSDALLEIEWNGVSGAAENLARCREIEDRFSDRTKHTTVMAGVQQFALPHTSETAANQAVIYIDAGSPQSMKALEGEIKDYIEDRWPHTETAFHASGNVFDIVFGGNEPLLEAKIECREGFSLSDTDSILERISAVLPGVKVAHPAVKQYMVLHARSEAMAMYGIGLDGIASYLREHLGDNTIRKISRGTVMVPVKMAGNSGQTDDITDGYIDNYGIAVPVKSVLTREYRDELTVVTAGRDGEYLPVSLDVPSSAVPSVMKTVSDLVAADDNVDISFSGTYFKDREMVRQLFSVLAISLVLLFLILAAQFESILQPFIIMSELLLDISVVIIVMKIAGISLNIMSMTGLTVMCGIVINDSILKVDTANRLVRAGGGVVRSLYKAGQIRLDAILMTSLTTIFAIAPFLVRGDMGSDLQYPMSAVIVTGMTIGTLASLFLVPLAYYSAYNHKKTLNCI